MTRDQEPRLFVFGSGGTAVEVQAVVRDCDPERSVSLVRAQGEAVDGADPALSEKEFRAFVEEHPGDHHYILAMTHQEYRVRWLAVAEELGLRPESVIHPRAQVARGAQVGAGCYLAANAVISNEAVLKGHCLVNYNVVVGHHARLGGHVVINPGASLGGNTTIGEKVLVGANAFISQGVTVGDRCSVDALTYVDRDLAADSLLTCRQLRTLAPEEPKMAATPPSVSEGRAVLLQVINRVREHNQRAPVASIEQDTSLRRDLEMDSLALAELTVNLEAAFGVDVFERGLVTTVGDVETRLGF